MEISKSTLSKIKAYILDTQAKSTYNSSPHHPLEMCYNPQTAEVWNLGNCYKYLNRYLATEGEKAGNINDLLKACHYAYLYSTRIKLNDNGSLADYVNMINEPSNIDDLFEKTGFINPDIIADFKNDSLQIRDGFGFWHFIRYFRIGILLIEMYERQDAIDLETT